MELYVVIGLIILILGIVSYFLSFHHKIPVTTASSPSSRPTRNFSQFFSLEQNNDNNKTRVELVLNKKSYTFYHAKDRGKEVRNIGEMIKKSIELMQESKYDDILNSRKKETLSQFNKLTKITTLSKDAYKEIGSVIENFRN